LSLRARNGDALLGQTFAKSNQRLSFGVILGLIFDGDRLDGIVWRVVGDIELIRERIRERVRIIRGRHAECARALW